MTDVIHMYLSIIVIFYGGHDSSSNQVNCKLLKLLLTKIKSNYYASAKLPTFAT